jgi:inhibitor of KinA
MPAYDAPRILPAGDRALTVELANEISPEINGRVRALATALARDRLPGIIDLVPTYRSLLVYYDPLRTGPEELKACILNLVVGDNVPSSTGKVLAIPVAYGGEYGPDMEFVARHAGLSPQEVADIHAGTDYLVYMIGFNTAFPYLGGMSVRISAPRLESPRTRIPAGSVGIAQQQTGIYPVDSPGGWQIIGRSPIRLFDPRRDPPVALEAGDFIRFVPIDASQFSAIERLVRSGAYQYVLTEATT